MGLVVVGAFTDPPGAHLAQARLAVEEIDSFLENEAVVQIYWLLSKAVGGVKVCVAEADAERALEILAEDHSLHSLEAVDYENVAAEDRCPECGSGEVSFFRVSREGGAVSLLVGFPVERLRLRGQCGACSHTWRLSEARELQLSEEDSELLTHAEGELEQESRSESSGWPKPSLETLWPLMFLGTIALTTYMLLSG